MEHSYTFVKIEELLPFSVRSQLTTGANTFYGAIWNVLCRRGLTQVTLTNADCSTKARVPLSFLVGVQRELVRAGLLHLEIVSEDTADGDGRTKYNLFDESQTATQ